MLQAFLPTVWLVALTLPLPLCAAATDARHGGPIAAANIVQTGERFGYAFHLALLLLGYPGGLSQLHIDIMCKWAPWSQRVVDALVDHPVGAAAASDERVQQLAEKVLEHRCGLDAMRKALSYVHGIMHAVNCQVGMRN